jgi:hypothetical protein
MSENAIDNDAISKLAPPAKPNWRRFDNLDNHSGGFK